MVTYVPAQGDIIWVTFKEQIGKETQKRRPALVLSMKQYNKLRGMAVVMPITSKTKGYSFEVPLKTPAIEGYVLSDQIKSIDWKMRNVEYIGTAEKFTICLALEKLNALFGIDLEPGEYLSDIQSNL